jgi:prepilin-type N-terminal cleavage/methylation domain-containing protein
MIRNRFEARRGRRDGFTLVEVLVTLVLIALLVGVVLPSVIRQLDRGEPVRISEDLEAVRSAAQLFRVDVRRWPGTLDQLVAAPDATTGWASNLDAMGQEIPAGLRARWNGPYLEIGELAGDTLYIGVGGAVLPALDTLHWGDGAFLRAQVENLTAQQAAGVSEIIDGHTNVSTAASGGRVRYDGTLLWYLMSPIN